MRAPLNHPEVYAAPPGQGPSVADKGRHCPHTKSAPPASSTPSRSDSDLGLPRSNSFCGTFLHRHSTPAGAVTSAHHRSARASLRATSRPSRPFVSSGQWVPFVERATKSGSYRRGLTSAPRYSGCGRLPRFANVSTSGASSRKCARPARSRCRRRWDRRACAGHPPPCQRRGTAAWRRGVGPNDRASALFRLSGGVGQLGEHLLAEDERPRVVEGRRTALLSRSTVSPNAFSRRGCSILDTSEKNRARA